MKLIKFDNVDSYYCRVKNYLLKHEAVNCLLLSNCLKLQNRDREKSAYLVLVAENQTILATAIQVSDRQLLISKSTSLSAVRLIAEDLAIDSQSISGITAPQLEAETFITEWQNPIEQSIELKMTMLIQQLDKLTAIDNAVGKLRLAVLRETELLTDWIQVFVREALGIDESKANLHRWVIRHLEKDSLYVWENKNQLVSMAACSGKTPNGIRVNSVYTPAKYKGHGYATSCVMQMSKILLEQQKYCFLFTDLENLTSNKIYRKIGYRPIGKILDYKFHQ